MRADRWRRLQVPFARVDLGEGFVGEYPGGADLHQVARELALQHAVLGAAEEHMRLGTEGIEIGAAGVVPVVAHTAIAGDAAVHLVADKGPKVLVRPGALHARIATHGVTGHHGHVLEVALAAFLAHRAVVGMVLHQPFDDLAAEIRRERRGARRLAVRGADPDPQAILDGHHAGHLQPAALVRFVPVLQHRAEAAGTDRAHGGVPAEVGEVELLGQAGVEEILTVGQVVVLAVYVDAGHPAISPAPRSPWSDKGRSGTRPPTREPTNGRRASEDGMSGAARTTPI